MSEVDDRTGGVQGVLEALAAAVEQARAMPMSSSVLVNRAELLDLVDQAREALPAQLTRADALLADADAARGEARAEAEAVLARAREQADRLVEAEAITDDLCRRQVERILSPGERRAMADFVAATLPALPG